MQTLQDTNPQITLDESLSDQHNVHHGYLDWPKAYSTILNGGFSCNLEFTLNGVQKTDISQQSEARIRNGNFMQ